VRWSFTSLFRREYRVIRSLAPLLVTLLLARLYRSAEAVPIFEKWFGPFPEGGSLIAALLVLSSVLE
jgi:hypothetical protein